MRNTAHWERDMEICVLLKEGILSAQTTVTFMDRCSNSNCNVNDTFNWLTEPSSGDLAVVAAAVCLPTVEWLASNSLIA